MDAYGCYGIIFSDFDISLKCRKTVDRDILAWSCWWKYFNFGDLLPSFFVRIKFCVSFQNSNISTGLWLFGDMPHLISLIAAFHWLFSHFFLVLKFCSEVPCVWKPWGVMTWPNMAVLCAWIGSLRSWYLRRRWAKVWVVNLVAAKTTKMQAENRDFTWLGWLSDPFKGCWG